MLLLHHINAITITTLQTFLLATTLQHTGWYDHRSPPQRLYPADLQLISHAAGSSLLRNHLPQLLAVPRPDDEALSDGRSSSKACEPRAAVQAKICIILGTVLGVIYTTFPNNAVSVCTQSETTPSGAEQPPVSTQEAASVKSSSTSPCAGGTDFSILLLPTGPFQNSPTQWLATKERLRLVLASELVRLARPLGFVPDTKTEAAIVEGLMKRNVGGRWAWGNTLVPPSAPLSHFSSPPHCGGGWGGEQRDSQDKDKSFYMDSSVGTFHPMPQAAMVGREEILSPHLPRPDPSDGRKRRSMILVGPWEDRQMYARMRAVGESGRPSMMA